MLRAMRASFFSIPGGDQGTRATLAHMRRLVSSGAVTPLVRTAAASIVRGIPGMDGTLQAKTIREWIADHVDFLRDPYAVEALHEPAVMLRAILTRGVAQVDCDDVAILAAALGRSIGLRARFVVVGFNSPKAPFRHVWAELADPRAVMWVDMDVTRPAQGLSALPISRSIYVEV